MACYMPFNSRNLDICFFIFRPTVVLVDEFVDSLKHFSLSTETLGCVQNSILKSIHGNLVSFLYFLFNCFADFHYLFQLGLIVSQFSLLKCFLKKRKELFFCLCRPFFNLSFESINL